MKRLHTEEIVELKGEANVTGLFDERITHVPFKETLDITYQLSPAYYHRQSPPDLDINAYYESFQ